MINAGLPNITGQLWNDTCALFGDKDQATSRVHWSGSLSTAFYSGGGNTGWEYNRTVARVIYENASGSNSIYGRSSTVQPLALQIWLCIKY